jgi:hypothetical protein
VERRFHQAHRMVESWPLLRIRNGSPTLARAIIHVPDAAPDAIMGEGESWMWGNRFPRSGLEDCFFQADRASNAWN